MGVNRSNMIEAVSLSKYSGQCSLSVCTMHVALGPLPFFTLMVPNIKGCALKTGQALLKYSFSFRLVFGLHHRMASWASDKNDHPERVTFSI